MQKNKNMKTPRFYLKSNFGHWSVMDTKTNKMAVGYSKKDQAQVTADGLNKIKTDSAIEKRIKSLQTTAGYGYYIRKGKSKAK